MTKKQKETLEALLNEIWQKERYNVTPSLERIKAKASIVGKWFYTLEKHEENKNEKRI